MQSNNLFQLKQINLVIVVCDTVCSNALMEGGGWPNSQLFLLTAAILVVQKSCITPALHSEFSGGATTCHFPFIHSTLIRLPRPWGPPTPPPLGTTDSPALGDHRLPRPWGPPTPPPLGTTDSPALGDHRLPRPWGPPTLLRCGTRGIEPATSTLVKCRPNSCATESFAFLVCFSTNLNGTMVQWYNGQKLCKPEWGLNPRPWHC
ncbi:hypothetical protein SKAU_G00178490 [Synaphobranchus kaupii]|uniref:Uncharacterized protein n=1 Tax=Synaphobranchus kaupii TaxID=118154 RepID=A0A9Q1FLU3_SYNKA|nr:hypothetical protein SKAU_G00178490 [Synaphobranchus kaupii]